MSNGFSPTLRRRRLSAELRRLREESGLTRDQVAKQLEWVPSKITRIEGAQWTRPNLRDVRDLLDVYGVIDENQREAYVQLARQARQRGWWSKYDDVFTGSFVGLEAETATIRTYEAQLVPGLLQTEDYARALISSVRPTANDEEVERRVTARMERQQLLESTNSPRYWVVLDEAVVRRPVGGPATMRDQLTRLVTVSRWPNVTIQVIPYSVGGHAGMEGPFVVLEFHEQVDPTVAYTEGLFGDVNLEETKDVRRYILAFEHVCASAMSPEDSRELIASAVKEL